MFKKIMSLVLACLLIQLVSAQPALANTKAAKEARFAEKVKEGIVKLGIGPEARISVSLKDKTKLEGYVSEAGEEHFVVTNLKTGISIPVAYPQVKKVKGNNLSKDTIITIAAVGALFALIFIIAADSR